MNTLIRPILAQWLAYGCIVGWATSMFGGNPPIRFANGLALAAYLMSRLSAWPILAVGFLAANTAARVLTGVHAPLWSSLLNAAEALTIAGLIYFAGRRAAARYTIERISAYFASVLIIPGLTALAFTYVAPAPTAPLFDAQWITRYTGAILGYLIITPLVISWADPSLREPTSPSGRATSRVLAPLLGCAGCAVLLYQENYSPLLLLTFPLVILVTWVSGIGGATAALAVIGSLGLWLTLDGHGAVVWMVYPETSLTARVQALQLYLLAVMMASLPLAVLLRAQRQLTKDLVRTSNARAEFLAAMSHEVRTPMTGVLGLTDLLAQEHLTEKQRSFVESIRSCGRHLLAILNDILDFSRIESGKLTLEERAFHIGQVLHEVESLCAPIATEQRLKFSIETISEIPTYVRGDAIRLKQVLLNLTTNALKFTPAGSVRLRVSAHCEQAHAVFRFEVADTGIGIAQKNIASLFEPFTQADQSIARDYGGSGLGLAISKRLATAMNGDIHVRSELGKGSAFILILPLQVVAQDASPRPDEPDSSHTSPKKILIAEDVELNREILHIALTSRGHDVAFAHNGFEAVQKVADGNFDLVLMDIQMPVMDGVEATRRIRAMSGQAGGIPIVALTANVLAQEQQEYRAAGMNDCLMKPIEWDRLFAAIKRYGGEASLSAPPRSDKAGEQQVVNAPEALGSADLPPLVDSAQLESVRTLAGQRLQPLMQAAFDSLLITAQAITSCADPQEVMRLAHKIKGSAGTYAMARVSSIAAEIEREAGETDVRERCYQELHHAIEATCEELVRLGLINPR